MVNIISDYLSCSIKELNCDSLFTESSVDP